VAGAVTFDTRGWQTISFAAPISVNPGATYVVSYHTSVGRYALDTWYFGKSGERSWPLESPGDWLVPRNTRNGVFKKGTSGFPKSSSNSSSYWVDPVFE
jgi:uncharacterized protein DUF4082